MISELQVHLAPTPSTIYNLGAVKAQKHSNNQLLAFDPSGWPSFSFLRAHNGHMYTNNPYAQGGWYNPANPQTINTERSANTHVAQPSIFGALPYPFADSAPQHLVFHFTYSTTTILNCSVYGPASKKFIEVVTDFNKTPQVTTLKKYDGSALGVIEWQQRPVVEITGVLPRQYIARWMPLSQGQR